MLIYHKRVEKNLDYNQQDKGNPEILFGYWHKPKFFKF